MPPNGLTGVRVPFAKRTHGTIARTIQSQIFIINAGCAGTSNTRHKEPEMPILFFATLVLAILKLVGVLDISWAIIGVILAVDLVLGFIFEFKKAYRSLK
jgi:hypothetical protein